MELKHILVVDDLLNWQAFFLSIMEDFLEDYSGKYELIVFGTTQATRSYLSEYKNLVQLAIVDLRLKDEMTDNVDGLALLREIKNNSPLAKVILVTAYPDRMRGQPHEADAFILKKPEGAFINIDHFQNIINKLLTQS